ncbi:MAG: hypothetical protein ACOX61_06055 [Brooklawnia sp.]|jgi:UDP-2,3-diacylglucosamine pyrophosphatase LpxH
MRTMQRLTRAYRNAKLVEFDSTSRFIIMSDSHRGDGSLSDEFTKNRHVFVAALNYYYDRGYTLIEAGDNDDLWEWPKFRHIVKANPLSFSTLRRFHDEDRYLRMYGNHDMQLADRDFVASHLTTMRDHLTGEQTPLFTDIEVHEAILLKHRETDQEVFVVHGHQGDFANDQAWRASMFTFRNFWRYLHALGIRSPTSPTRNSFKRHKVERNYARWIRRHGVALVCGHTHRERYPRKDDAPYFNAGSCVYPNYITGLEIANDRIKLVTWRVEPDANAYLHVARRVLAGPRPLSDFDSRPDPTPARRPARTLDWTVLENENGRRRMR